MNTIYIKQTETKTYIDTLINNMITTRVGSFTQTSLNGKLNTYTTSIGGESGKAIQIDIISPVTNSTFKGGNTILCNGKLGVVDTCYLGRDCNIIGDISIGGRSFLVDPTNPTRTTCIDALISNMITTRLNLPTKSSVGLSNVDDTSDANETNFKRNASSL